MRELAGVLLKDVPRYVRRLARCDSRDYLRVCNRNERLEPAPQGEGMRCQWQWASDLHAPRRLPALGSWLMRRALTDHPVRSATAPMEGHGTPQVSFVIGHRGEERIPLLMATLRSIAAQEGARIECIVVQQEQEPTLATRLPRWVRYVHTPTDQGAQPFSRSEACNAGARHASAPVLVLHDNDMLVPADYAAHVLARVAEGWHVVNLKRFVFYLSEGNTAAWLRGEVDLIAYPPHTVTQNLEGGGSIAITREGFEHIGGMDESFAGWGGEDNEFWERALMLKAWQWASLPLVHLWHPAQAGKHDATAPGVQRYYELAQIDPAVRIERLRASPSGQLSGPSGWPKEAA
jgi:GT2 family glycosyltransferase